MLSPCTAGGGIEHTLGGYSIDTSLAYGEWRGYEGACVLYALEMFVLVDHVFIHDCRKQARGGGGEVVGIIIIITIPRHPRGGGKELLYMKYK